MNQMIFLVDIMIKCSAVRQSIASIIVRKTAFLTHNPNLHHKSQG